MKCWQAGYWAEVEDAGRGLYSVFQCRSLHSYLRHPLSRSLVDAMVYLFWNLKSLDCGRKAWSQCGMCWPQILLSVIGCCRSLSGWSGRGNAEECPEGQPEICAPGRTNLACNNCLPKYYPTGSGDCKACEDYDTLGFYVAVIVMWCGAAILSRVMSVGISQSSLSKLTVLAVGNQLVMVVQTFSTISKLAIAWPEPVKTLIELADLIMRLGCTHVTGIPEFVQQSGL